MVYTKSTSKYDSKCSYEKEGLQCSNQIKVGDDYVYDTDARKAYCAKHEDINSKIAAKPQGGGGGFGKGIPLCRSPEEGITAIKIWNDNVIPLIVPTAKKIYGDTPKPEQVELIMKSFQEIFLGKFHPVGSSNFS